MRLPENLHQILREELENDPLGLGYCNFNSSPAMIASKLNECRSVSKKYEHAITAPDEYLDALEEATDIENIQYVKWVVAQIPSEGQSHITALSENAGPLLQLLDTYGIDAFLNTLMISDVVTGDDKPLFEVAVREILYHAANIGLSYFETKNIKQATVPRVSEIFSGIPEAPNVITEQDILDVIEAKIKDGSCKYHI